FVQGGRARPRVLRLPGPSHRSSVFRTVDRHRPDEDRLAGTVAFSLADGSHPNCTGDVQPLGHLAEDRPGTIQGRRVAQSNIDLAGRRFDLPAGPGPNRATHVPHLVADPRLHPVADAALAGLAGAQRAARLDQLQGDTPVLAALADGAVELQ